MADVKVNGVLIPNVSETMLWTLANRASEAENKFGCIQDRKCIEIAYAIDYDYEASFGKPDGSHGLRSALFDRIITGFIKTRKNAVIVDLGGGLETQRYRIPGDELLWITLDLPTVIDLREQFIPPDDNHLHIRQNVLDTSWFDQVPTGRPVFIAAQGLFMFLEPNDVKSLFQQLAQRFRGSRIMFDFISPFFSKRTMSKKGWRLTKQYTTPPMPWGVKRNMLQETLEDWLDTDLEIYPVPFVWPSMTPKRTLIRLLNSMPIIKNNLPGIVWFDFPD